MEPPRATRLERTPMALRLSPTRMEWYYIAQRTVSGATTTVVITTKYGERYQFSVTGNAADYRKFETAITTSSL